VGETGSLILLTNNDAPKRVLVQILQTVYDLFEICQMLLDLQESSLLKDIAIMVLNTMLQQYSHPVSVSLDLV
jgi:hypothetical protein